MKTLPEMLERIREEATKIFMREHTLIPTFIGMRPDGTELLISADDVGIPDDYMAQSEDEVRHEGHRSPTPEAKDKLLEYVRAHFAAARIRIYGVAMECWVLQVEEDRDYGRKGISQEPGRYEALWFSAEDRTSRICARQSIIRPAGKEASLDDDFQIMDGYDAVKGRFTDLLNLPEPRKRPLPGMPDSSPRSMREAIAKMDPNLRALLLAIAEVELNARERK